MLGLGFIPKSDVIEIVLKKLDDKVEFFMNSKLEPMVRVVEDGFQQDWPADSQRFLDLLNAVYYDNSLAEFLEKSEREFLLSKIREKCRKGIQRFTHLEAAEAEANPIVQAIICFVNGRERYEGRTAILLEILRDSQFADCFPRATNNFSRRLKRSIDALRSYGIEVSIRHQEDGSHCLISRMESFAIEPDITLNQVHDPDDARNIVRTSSARNMIFD